MHSPFSVLMSTPRPGACVHRLFSAADLQGAYNPADYADLPVTEDVQVRVLCWTGPVCFSSACILHADLQPLTIGSMTKPHAHISCRHCMLCHVTPHAVLCHAVLVWLPSWPQDMFKYIGRYTPQPLAPLPTKLMPFIPEYIPAVGGTDEFIKVPRPDGQPDYLGLKVGVRGGCVTWKAAGSVNSAHCSQPSQPLHSPCQGGNPLNATPLQQLTLNLFAYARCSVHTGAGRACCRSV